MPLLPIGQLVKADSKGVLPRIGRSPDPSWSTTLDDLTKQLCTAMKDRNFSIALRGSVARGASINEAADLDLVILYDGRPPMAVSLQSNVSPQLSIEASYVPLKELEADDTWIWMRFMLAHNGHTIRGPDLLPALPEPRIGPHCYAHLRNADKWLQEWHSFWEQDEDHHAICEWLMKRIVRSLFESQITRINAFSRDIYPCCQVAMDAFPESRKAIKRAAELAVEPIANHSVIADIVRELSGPLLTKQSELGM